MYNDSSPITPAPIVPVPPPKSNKLVSFASLKRNFALLGRKLNLTHGE